MALTTSQLKRLGQRLGRMENPDPADLDLLDEFELSFDAAQEHVVETIREQLRIDPTARRKTPRSIVAKIRRQHTALSRMQDIAGCRLVVEDIVNQDDTVGQLCELPWERHAVEDRRLLPSHGYRAVHVIVTVDGRPVEVQVRTQLQDLWAQMSEKMADRYGLDVKYGRGPDWVQTFLGDYTHTIARDRGPSAARRPRDVRVDDHRDRFRGAGAQGRRPGTAHEPAEEFASRHGYPFRMTIFLLEYDPASGERVRFEVYPPSERAAASAERLRIEKENARAGRDREVLLLEAVSEDALRTTHGRYFKTLAELVETSGLAI